MSQDSGIVAMAREVEGLAVIAVKKPSRRYMDEFIHLKCAPDLLVLDLFPNSKEITESLAAVAAVRKNLWGLGFEPGNREVICLVIGDGGRPRTAACMAMLTAWSVYSIDPGLKPRAYERVRRLVVARAKAEDYLPTLDLAGRLVVVLAVHSHAPLDLCWRQVQDQVGEDGRVALVSIPCCVPDRCGEPARSYVDWGIWSPERRVNVYLGPGVGRLVAVKEENDEPSVIADVLAAR